MTEELASVLVVDDEWIIRQQLARALGSIGVSCECAIDGDDALHKYRSRHHSLVVTDLRMPAHNGHSLAVTLLAEPKPPQIVALTGVREPRLARDLLMRGVSDVIFKPINYFDLADRLKCLLETPASGNTEQQPESRHRATTSRSCQSVQTRGRGGSTRERLEARLLQNPPSIKWLNMALRWFDWHSILDPPPEAHELLKRVSEKLQNAPDDRRSEKRVAFPEVAVAIPLDDIFEPVDEPLKMLVRNLSPRGIGLLHTQGIEAPHLAITWRTRKMGRVIAVIRITRCQPLGRHFDIAGEVLN